jgi:CubicO group peptidase (beta-lactamase class C family)
MKKSIIILVVLFLNLNFACKKDTLDIKTPSQLSDKLTELQAKSILPGFAVSIIKGDSVYFQEGFGFADRITKTPYTPNTIQPVGSVSKTFIAMALMQCVQQGLFTLETDINSILPFEVKNPNHPDKPIKIKHLATHTSGILDNPTFYFQSYELGKVPSTSLEQFIKDYFTPGGRFYAVENFANKIPDAQYNYTNFGASLAAYIIEVKTGESFDKFTKRTIFTPLNMNGTSWFHEDANQANYATLYEVNSQIEPIYNQVLNADGSVKTYCSLSYPDGSLKTSCADLTKYLVEMLKGYDKKGGILLDETNYTTLFAPRYTSANLPTDMDEKEPNRAIFWAHTRTGRISHTGGDLGVSAFISFNPATKTGRIVMLNTQLDGDDNTKSITQFTEIANAISAYESSL